MRKRERSRFNLLNQYQETILEIIENKGKFELTTELYKVLMLLSYLQLYIYLLNYQESNISNDSKLESFSKIISMVSLNNILLLKNSDTLSGIAYILVSFLQAAYFIYVAIVSILKHYFLIFYESNDKLFGSINSLLNVYFALYIQYFFTFFTELNSSLIFCSPRSLFSSYRVDKNTQSTCTIPFYMQFIGCIGLALTIWTAWITCYFYRNYAFLEPNPMKRRVSLLYGLVIVARFFLTVLYYANLSHQNIVKHLISHFIGVISILDYFINSPYSDSDISLVYLKVISWYYAGIIIANVWIFEKGILENYEYLYFFMFLAFILQIFFQALHYQRYHVSMQLKVKSNTLPHKLDIFLEEIIRLAIVSNSDQQAKLKLISCFKNHVSVCENSVCACIKIEESRITVSKKGLISKDDQAIQSINKSETFELKLHEAFDLVDSIFQFFLHQKKLEITYQNSNAYL